MLAGLGTLSQLRALCLPDGFGPADSQFDDVLANIGRGVGAQFDALCNRKFARLEGAQEIFDGQRRVLSLSRYPLESVSAIERRYGDALNRGDWMAAVSAGVYWNRTNFEAGLVDTCEGLGVLGELRVTFTGGFFVPDDPAEDGTPDPTPDGAARLPEDLNLGWQLQSAHVFEASNYFGTAAIRKPGQFERMPPLTRVEILPSVRATLDRYARMSL